MTRKVTTKKGITFPSWNDVTGRFFGVEGFELRCAEVHSLNPYVKKNIEYPFLFDEKIEHNWKVSPPVIGVEVGSHCLGNDEDRDYITSQVNTTKTRKREREHLLHLYDSDQHLTYWANRLSAAVDTAARFKGFWVGFCTGVDMTYNRNKWPTLPRRHFAYLARPVKSLNKDFDIFVEGIKHFSEEARRRRDDGKIVERDVRHGEWDHWGTYPRGAFYEMKGKNPFGRKFSERH